MSGFTKFRQGTPPVDATRRDVSRPGRLYWLAGRRSATENWDAFEAPRGEPFLISAADVRLASGASCALEPGDRARCLGSRRQGHRLTSRACLEASGRTTRAPRFLVARAVAPDANQTLNPVELLAAVSTRAFAPTTEPAAPLSATTLLNRLASGAPPALADVKAELLRLASIPSRPSRIRRALPIVMAAMPVAVPILAVTVMLPNYVRSFEGELLMWMTWITDSGADAEFKTQEQRTAAEQYVAAHFGSQLTSDEFWNTQAPQMEFFVDMRRRAAEIAARYPAVSPDELARASAIVAPQIQEVADWRANFPGGGEALRGFVASGFASIPVLFSIVCGLISVLAVPGGLVTRALRHAVVRRDGREIGRVRSAVRLLIAWSPVIAWMAYVGNPMFGELRAMSPAAAYAVGGLALMSVAAGAVWTIAVPGRGPHDRIAGTWVVPR